MRTLSLFSFILWMGFQGPPLAALDAEDLRRLCDHEFELANENQDIEYKVNLYEQESVTSKVLHVLSKGDFVEYTGRSGEAFAEVRALGVTGWVINRGALMGNKGVLCYPVIVERRICDNAQGKLSGAPLAPVVKTLPASTNFDFFHYSSSDGTSFFVRLKDGTTGWLLHEKNICYLAQDNKPPATSSLKSLDVRYFNQGDAGLGRTNDSICGITSLAMGLSYFDQLPQKTPRDLFYWSQNIYSNGFRRAQTPAGMASMARALGMKSSVATTSGTVERIKEAIDQGFPVVVHGYFTNGHIVLVKGYDRDGFVVNDPYGEWNQYTVGRPPSIGYLNRRGETVKYRYSAFLNAVSTRPAGNDIWMTILMP